jgi:hypothetical protein
MTEDIVAVHHNWRFRLNYVVLAARQAPEVKQISIGGATQGRRFHVD